MSTYHECRTLVNVGAQRKSLCIVINSDTLSKVTRWFTNPMIRFQIAQISDPMNPCPEWIRGITDLKIDSLKGTDQTS